MADQCNLREVDAIVAAEGRGPDAVIPILQAIQARFRYLPDQALERVCAVSDITPAAIEGVATFYSQFRRTPVGNHIISVCDGTACHVKGSGDIFDAVKEELHLDGDADTDAKGEFTIQKVACLGCCSLAPAVQIDGLTYARVRPGTVHGMLHDFLEHGANGDGLQLAAPRAVRAEGAEVRIGLDSCCVAGGSGKVQAALERALADVGSTIPLKHVSCVHMCHQIPLVEVIVPGQDPHRYYQVQPEEAVDIVARHFKPRKPFAWLKTSSDRWLDHLYTHSHPLAPERLKAEARDRHIDAFLSHQRHIATEGRGELNPADLDEYARKGGFMALEKVLTGRAAGEILLARHRGDAPASSLDHTGAWSAQRIIDELLASGLRGRGGAGFPTGRKWQFVHDAPGDRKFIICNGDEGDPGAFMDRMILESYPYRVIEGMVIAALAVGAEEGFLYIRAEYPLATRRMRQAIEDCTEAGILGDDILGSGHRLTLQVKEGAGAFVCGEETALIASLEGRRGMPSIRPPYPAQQGLHGCPTLINNTETLAMVPWVLRNGADAFAALGTEKSKGTKVFSLAGKILNGGLIEVPMGITLREIVEEIGGGVEAGHRAKAVLVGGPSGGCIPESLFDTPVDYEALSEVGAMMGSGGMVVLDDADCIVEMARYFLSFTQEESCGKCTPCRIGTKRMLEMLDRLCAGKGKAADLEQLEELGRVVKNQSLCGLGKTAPNPVLTALRYFREEFEAHVAGKCPAGRCKALIDYWVEDTCIGCTKCAQVCPVDCIETQPYRLHIIDLDVCTRCDVCREACPVDAIKAGSRDPVES